MLFSNVQVVSLSYTAANVDTSNLFVGRCGDLSRLFPTHYRKPMSRYLSDNDSFDAANAILGHRAQAANRCLSEGDRSLSICHCQNRPMAMSRLACLVLTLIMVPMMNAKGQVLQPTEASNQELFREQERPNGTHWVRSRIFDDAKGGIHL
jgi:hypothetical protein